jgi:hypothetical protein
VADRVRRLSEGDVRFGRPVLEAFREAALADPRVGSRLYKILSLIKEEGGLVELKERGRVGDPDDDLNDPLTRPKKARDARENLPVVGQDIVERAMRLAEARKLDWENLDDRQKAMALAMADRKLGEDNGYRRVKRARDDEE